MRYSSHVMGPSISRPRGPQSSEPSIEATTDAEQHVSYAPSFAPLREYITAQVQVAQESERLRKTLLDCVSHELKTPLAAIAAASQELSRLTANIQDSQILKELAGEIRDGSHRLNRVVNNLLDMNRLESG